MKLYVTPGSPYARMARIVAPEKGLTDRVFQPLSGIGHFPFAENPALFANHLLPILRELDG
jgi:pimeloyl-ACP methyl ester carboxylesterase